MRANRLSKIQIDVTKVESEVEIWWWVLSTQEQNVSEDSDQIVDDGDGVGVGERTNIYLQDAVDGKWF